MDRGVLTIGIVAWVAFASLVSGVAAAPVNHGPLAPGEKMGTSTNWAGYAIETNLARPASGAVTDVQGNWIVPAVTCAGGGTDAYSAAWLGIDGYASNSVEQTGTESDCLSGGATPYYAAWYEMYPKPSFRISMAISPGDKMFADVHYNGNGKFHLTLTDTTTGATFSTTQASSKAKRSSAEWIEEAPSSGGVLPLANFGNDTFSAASATLNGHGGNISDASWQSDAITMVNGAGQVKCATGGLSGGTAFTETWQRAT
ncbi:MAG: G1 family glutamic endopeptidase [Thermoplasmatota archaeon]